ncbi:ATP-grasp domain-containing protein, partial [Candidatus Micrarchaeota archaeon]|nr:ATP-grasp domain-containing protein [Candidatus Micrarchaeota archaeon]
KPLGHVQIEGDYHSSWMGSNTAEYLPHVPERTRDMNEELAAKAERRIYETTKKITDVLGGRSIFGCELFVKADGDDAIVYGNEVACRPHDTGLVTFLSHQNALSEFGLHIRAVCGFPIPSEKNEDGFRVLNPVANAASHVILSPHEGHGICYRGLWKCMNMQGVSLKIFGKPEAHVGRRLGVVVAMANSVLEAKKKAEIAAHTIEVKASGTQWKNQTDMETRKHIVFAKPRC